MSIKFINFTDTKGFLCPKCLSSKTFDNNYAEGCYSCGYRCTY